MSKQKRKPQYHLITLGCSKNSVDSDSMAALLAHNGFNSVLDAEDAGILIVNTSPVIGHLWALTRTKWTNGLFLVATTLAVLLVAYNLMRSFIH